jgi:hypothetical protein
VQVAVDLIERNSLVAGRVGEQSANARRPVTAKSASAMPRPVGAGERASWTWATTASVRIVSALPLLAASRNPLISRHSEPTTMFGGGLKYPGAGGSHGDGCSIARTLTISPLQNGQRQCGLGGSREEPQVILSGSRPVRRQDRVSPQAGTSSRTDETSDVD